ncbi:MAG: zf-HC2 domain-containing protein [Acidimicrobiia bacterium]
MIVTCGQLELLLPEFFDGTLTAEQETAAADHLATCTDCRTIVSELEGVSSLSLTHGRLVLPEASRNRIRAALGLDPPPSDAPA